MSYTVTLGCGCRVYVACHLRNGHAHTRTIEARSSRCAIRSHDVGVSVPLWELLPYEPDEPSTPARESRSSKPVFEHVHR